MILPAELNQGNLPSTKGAGLVSPDASGFSFGNFFGQIADTAANLGTTLLSFDLQKDILRDQLAITQLEGQIADAETAAQTPAVTQTAPPPSFFETYEKQLVLAGAAVAVVVLLKIGKVI